MTRLLAIDPGTNVMGLALFDGPDLVGSRSVVAPARLGAEDRLTLMMMEIRAMIIMSHCQAIAIEKPGASNPAHRPATLLALCTFIRQAARTEWHIPLAEYATGTITAAVAPRGWPGDRKAKLRAGVVALMDEQARRLGHGPDGAHFQDAPQDVIDAIAVGFCHLAKSREKELVSDDATGRSGPMTPRLCRLRCPRCKLLEERFLPQDYLPGPCRRCGWSEVALEVVDDA